MALYKTDSLKERINRRTGRTGIARLRVIDTPDGNRKRVGIYRLDHPVDSAQDASRRKLDANTIETKSPIKFKDLKAGYHVDSYIRQAVDKYAEKMVLAGYHIKSKDPEIVKYLNYRMLALGKAAGYDFHLLISDIARRYVRDGNVFLVKAYTKTGQPLPGYDLRGLRGRPVIGGFFLLEAECMVPLIDKETGERKGWIYRYQDGLTYQNKLFPIDQIYHFTYCPEGNDDWGYSMLGPALEDVRSLRNAEEAILKLIYRHLNPLIHVVAPDLLDDGQGRQEDVDLVSELITRMAHDGFVVTGPGYEMSSIGAESQALRAEAYLDFFKARSFTGLGVSDLIMGEAQYMGAGGSDAVSVQMADRANFMQWALSRWLTSTLIYDLLIEADIDPIDQETKEYIAVWKFNEFDATEKRAHQAHMTDAFTKGTLTRKEARNQMGLEPLTEEEENDTYMAIMSKLERQLAELLETKKADSAQKIETKRGKNQLAVVKARPKTVTRK